MDPVQNLAIKCFIQVKVLMQLSQKTDDEDVIPLYR